MVFSIFAYKLSVDKWKPIWFLSSLGSGGLAVAFYILFLYRIPASSYSRTIDGVEKMVAAPVVTFEAIKNAWNSGSDAERGLIVLNYIIIYALFIKHIHLLVWNFIYLARRWPTPAHARYERKNEDVNMMAVPLTLAMTINASFAVGAISVPGLWNYVEKLFPLSIVGLILVGILGLSIYINYIGGFFVEGGFACDKNGHLGQMLAVFAFSMIAVGFSGPMAMTYNKTTFGFAMMGVMLFGGLALLFIIPVFTMGMRMMMISGITHEAAASVAVIIPIITVLSITGVRIRHGLNENVNAGIGAWTNLVLLSFGFSLQLFFLALGGYVLAKIKYFSRFIIPGGSGWTPLVYTIVCPGVALVVLGHFWLHKGLVSLSVLKFNSPVYWTLFSLLSVVQLIVVIVIEMIDFKMFVMKQPSTDPAKGPSEVQLEQTTPSKRDPESGESLVNGEMDGPKLV